mmetsp:Transcript_88456/g.223403  ORF Transcript_88456/g.223403 Transcript_88456/m.223403 type:complete len:298 (+) Transcript_88456:791-1684(+)
MTYGSKPISYSTMYSSPVPAWSQRSKFVARWPLGYLETWKPSALPNFKSCWTSALVAGIFASALTSRAGTTSASCAPSSASASSSKAWEAPVEGTKSISSNQTYSVVAARRAAFLKALIGYNSLAQLVLSLTSPAMSRGSWYSTRLSSAALLSAVSTYICSMVRTAVAALSASDGTWTAQLILPDQHSAITARRGKRSTLHCVTIVIPLVSLSMHLACKFSGAQTCASKVMKSSSLRNWLTSLRVFAAEAFGSWLVHLSTSRRVESAFRGPAKTPVAAPSSSASGGSSRPAPARKPP